LTFGADPDPKKFNSGPAVRSCRRRGGSTSTRGRRRRRRRGGGRAALAGDGEVVQRQPDGLSRSVIIRIALRN